MGISVGGQGFRMMSVENGSFPPSCTDIIKDELYMNGAETMRVRNAAATYRRVLLKY